MLRALIADDEETIRLGLAALVESSGLGITVIATARNGQEALEAVKAYSPEIILMDINMPQMNGLKAIAHIREINAEAKIIIISGYSEFSYAQQAVEMGVHAYLLKPLDYRNFGSVLAKAIEAYLQRMWERSRLHSELPSAEDCQDVTVAALSYIRENFTDRELSLASVAERFHVSQSYLSKFMKQKTGSSFTAYVNDLRITLATQMLQDTERAYTICEIADRCGYGSQHYFSRAFKQSVGMSPAHYRAQLPPPKNG